MDTVSDLLGRTLNQPSSDCCCRSSKQSRRPASASPEMAPDGVNQLQVAAELKAPVTIVALTTLLRDSSVSVTIRSMREREVPAKEVRPCSLEFKRLGRALQSSRTE